MRLKRGKRTDNNAQSSRFKAEKTSTCYNATMYILYKSFISLGLGSVRFCVLAAHVCVGSVMYDGKAEWQNEKSSTYLTTMTTDYVGKLL